MKILFVAQHMSTGGMPQYLLSCVKRLVSNGDEVFVIEYNDISPEYVVQRNKLKDLCSYKILCGNEVDKEKDLFATIQSFSPDIIHLMEFPEAWMPTMTTKRLYDNYERKFRIIETSHGSGFNPGNKVYWPDGFVFVSEFHVNQYQDKGTPWKVVSYPIEHHNRPDRTESLKKLNLDPKQKHVLQVGLFAIWKNQGKTFEVARRLSEVQFHFVGNQASNFESYWKPIMLVKPDNCRLWGERSDIDSFYSSMDLLFFPSIWEMSPLVIREALGWGMPVLMRDLPVYCGEFTKYSGINFMGINLSEMCREVEEVLSRQLPIDNLEQDSMLSDLKELYLSAVSNPVKKQITGPIRLNLGSGFRKQEGYVNIDNRKETNPDLVLDVTKGLPYGDSTVDEIRAYDFLEHIPSGQSVVNTIEEIYRVLKPNGKLDHFTPSTDGRGAFQDPYHLSYWNENSWKYYMEDDYRNLYGTKAKFSGENTTVLNDPNENISYVHGVLQATKPNVEKEDSILISFFDGARVEILGESNKKYKVTFIDNDTEIIIYSGIIAANHWVAPNIKYYVNWLVKVFHEDGTLVREEKFDPTGKRVVVHLDSMALGDTLAWIPYAEEFRRKHDCEMFVDTFHNDLFIGCYPEITFFLPTETIPNVYARYSIGVRDDNYDHNRNNWRTVPLQKVASDYLGLEHKEIRPRVKKISTALDLPIPYVTISEHSTMLNRYWLYPGGWQMIVDFLKDYGYSTVVVSKEKSELKNVIDRTDRPLEQTMENIAGASLHIGLTTGPSWLCWAIGTPLVMISGVSEPWFEMSECTRIHNDKVCHGCGNDPKHFYDRGNKFWCPRDKKFECSRSITPETVIREIKMVLPRINLTGAGNQKPVIIKKKYSRISNLASSLIERPLCIAVLVYNQLEITKRCVESILKNTKSNFRLVLWNNGSRSDVGEYLQNICVDPKIEGFKSDDNEGFIFGNNRIFEEYKDSKYFCVLNNDVIIEEPGWDLKMIAALNKDEKIGQVCNYQKTSSLSHEMLGGWDRKDGQPLDYVAGYCFMVRSKIIRDNLPSLFDEKYLSFGYGEDVDLSFRLKSLGYKLAEVDIKVKHFLNQTLNNETMNDVPLRIALNDFSIKNNEVIKERWGIPFSEKRPAHILVKGVKEPFISKAIEELSYHYPYSTMDVNVNGRSEASYDKIIDFSFAMDNVPDLSFLKHLAFEINNECPLTKNHPKCPRNVDRFQGLAVDKPIEDSKIISFVEFCSSLGFQGRILFDCYNEPTCSPERIASLMKALPKSRFSLWTNGVLIKGTEEYLKNMDDIMVTIYPETNREALINMKNNGCKFRTQIGSLDNRIETVNTKFNPQVTICGRPNWELICDYYGNFHMCCGDWKAEMKIGNLNTNSPIEIITRWNSLREVINKPWTSDTFRELPMICRICSTRTPQVTRV